MQRSLAEHNCDRYSRHRHGGATRERIKIQLLSRPPNPAGRK